jgi:hypothetical protein
MNCAVLYVVFVCRYKECSLLCLCVRVCVCVCVCVKGRGYIARGKGNVCECVRGGVGGNVG